MEEARAVAEAMEVEDTLVAAEATKATEVEVTMLEATQAEVDTNLSLSLSTSVSPMAPTVTGSD